MVTCTPSPSWHALSPWRILNSDIPQQLTWRADHFGFPGARAVVVAYPGMGTLQEGRLLTRAGHVVQQDWTTAFTIVQGDSCCKRRTVVRATRTNPYNAFVTDVATFCKLTVSWIQCFCSILYTHKLWGCWFFIDCRIYQVYFRPCISQCMGF